MKKVSKKLCSWLMIMAMVLSVVYIQTPIVAKAEEKTAEKSTKVEIGNPTLTGFKDGLATYKFNDTLNLSGTNIKSIAVQFVSPVIKKDGEKNEYIEYNEVKDIFELCNKVERLKKTDGNYTHIIINAKDGENLTADEWKTLLIKCFTVHVKIGNVQSVMLSVSDEKVSERDNLVEYYAHNGHYYEPVQGKLSWTEAREASLEAASLDPKKYDSYLVNITSQEENDFIYTICRKSSWIGATCEPAIYLNGRVGENGEIEYDNQIGVDYPGYFLYDGEYNSENANKYAYWFYVDGPEAGSLMTYGPAHDCRSDAVLNNYMKMALENTDYDIFGEGKKAKGAYETKYEKNGDIEFTNWANYENWKKSPVYEKNIGNKKANEPNNQNPSERFMAVFARDDWDNEENDLTFMIPSMWNDYPDEKTDINSYIIEYSLKDGFKPDEDTQSICDLEGKEYKITGDDFSVRGKSGDLTVADIVSEDKGNVIVQKYDENPRPVDPEITQEDLDKVNKAIEDNIATDVIVTVKDKSTDQTIRLKITIIPVATIFANDFIISVEDAQKADDKRVKESSNAAGKDETGKDVDDDKLVVDKDDLNKLNDTKEPGEVTIKLTNTSDIEPSTTVTAHVVDEVNTGYSPERKEIVIGANNFDISVDDVDKALAGDEGILKKLANVVATEGGDNIPTENIDVDDVYKTDLKAEPGKYPVTFTYGGISVTVEATVKSNNDYKGSETPEDDNQGDNNPGDDNRGDNNPKEDNTIIKSGTPVASSDIVYEKTNPQDKTEPIDPAKQVANTGALKINGVPVDNYTVSPDGKGMIISKDYIDTLPKGTYQAMITYTDGTEQKFSITVVDYDEKTVVKNPPLFSMYKEIVLKKNNTFTVNLSGITDRAVVKADITGKSKNAKKVVSIKKKANGDVVITPKKVGKSQVTCTIIQNGAEYKVVVDLKVLKQYKGTSTNYNLKNAGLVKTGGELPEFNVYKRIVKGKNTKIKFTKVEKDANVKFYVANKKEAKSLKIGKVKRSGKTVTCTIKGKKKGWVHLTAEITQNGKTYYTRLLVRIDDGTWTSKQLKKYLK